MRRAVVTGTLLALAGTLLAAPGTAAPTGPPGPADLAAPVALHHGAPTLPSGFTDKVAIGGLSEPTAVAFAPDGTAFVALKSGEIKSFDYDNGTRAYEPFAQHTIFTDLSPNVHNYWDRGLTGIEVDRQFPTRPYVYVNYSLNRDPRNGNQPAWTTGDQQYDGCPAAAALGPPPVAGCIVDIRVARLTATYNGSGWVMVPGSEVQLVRGACMQFPSHASGDVAMGPDGYLYASAGDGASFDFADHGQAGNPCPGDPANQGGSLRSQDPRTNGDDLSLSGSVFRIHPDTGNPKTGSGNGSRIIAYGHRNPWRLTFRPGTDELWNGDVGGSAWEEINRLQGAGSAPTGVGAANRGWPCYEGTPSGSAKQPQWDALNLPVCENLYASPGNLRAPYFGYQTRGGPLTTGEHCESSTSSVSGIAFAPASSNWPAAYKGSLFFSDYARACVWRLGKLPNGDPDPQSITPFVQSASTPVDLVAGPQGDLFYVDYGIDEASGQPTAGLGAIHRIAYLDPSPVATLTANRISGPLSASYTFSAAGTRDPNNQQMTFAWDLDGNGSFETDTGTGRTAQRTYGSPVNVTVRVRATNQDGFSGTASLTVYPGNDPSRLTSIAPSSSLRWQVGQGIGFSATGTDPQDGVLAPTAFDWALSIRHCPDVCHTHPLEQFRDRRSGSFRAPDHEFPSHLLLTLTLTDSRSMPVRRTIRLDPKSVKVTFATKPRRLRLTAAGTAAKAPFAKRFIVRSRATVSAPRTQRKQGVTYRFRRWSDRGDPSHEIVAPAKKATLTAAYRAVKAQLRVRATPGQKLTFRVNGTKAKGSFRDDFRIGAKVWLVAPRVQTRKGKRWVFVRWSDGGPRVRGIVIGDRRVDLRAVYRRT